MSSCSTVDDESQSFASDSIEIREQANKYIRYKEQKVFDSSTLQVVNPNFPDP